MKLQNGIYKHYKGGIYEVLGIGKHTETGEDLVFYKDAKNVFWVRPLDMFTESVIHEGERVERFILVQ